MTNAEDATGDVAAEQREVLPHDGGSVQDARRQAKRLDRHGGTTGGSHEESIRSGNSRTVEDRDGVEVDLDEWDPTPSELRALDDVDESTLSDPMEGPAPTG